MVMLLALAMSTGRHVLAGCIGPSFGASAQPPNALQTATGGAYIA